MSRVLHYPKIPDSQQFPLGKCIAFEKCDGTNMHFCWNRDFGWHAFGTRRDEFNLTDEGIALFVAAHPELNIAAEVFGRQLAEGIETVFQTTLAYESPGDFKVFAEFFGAHSFAGSHRTDDPKELRLFDVEVEGFGLIGPEQFVRDFGHLPIARVVYQGRFSGAFADAVREGKYPVVEGVVCKAGSGGKDLWMAKIKTHRYLQRLKSAFGERWIDYWE
jgi:hypothetical protein